MQLVLNKVEAVVPCVRFLCNSECIQNVNEFLQGIPHPLDLQSRDQREYWIIQQRPYFSLSHTHKLFSHIFPLSLQVFHACFAFDPLEAQFQGRASCSFTLCAWERTTWAFSPLQELHRAARAVRDCRKGWPLHACHNGAVQHMQQTRFCSAAAHWGRAAWLAFWWEQITFSAVLSHTLLFLSLAGLRLGMHKNTAWWFSEKSNLGHF